MKKAQIAVLLLAVTAGGGAIFLIKQPEEGPQPEVIVMPSQTMATKEVLVAASDLPMWRVLEPEDLHWQPWPEDSLPAGVIRRDEDALASAIAGMMTRSSFARGEPLRMERLAEGSAGSGPMSATLPPGRRAMAISIDSRGSSSAGGFIHPEDRVDVIHVVRDPSQPEGGHAETQISRTLLTNIRVLAIGQNVQVNTQGETTIQGETATVELTNEEAEAIALAERTGHLTLALRSSADKNESVEKREEPRAVVVTGGGSAGFTFARYSLPPQTGASVARRDIGPPDSRQRGELAVAYAPEWSRTD